MAPDHYEVLGVTPDARHTDVRAAYRQLMQQHHPDRRPGDPTADEIARQVTAAWAVLGKPSRRAAYDRARAAARQPGPLPMRPPRVADPAYSPAGRDYRREFSLASRKVATAVLLLGVVVLLAISR